MRTIQLTKGYVATVDDEDFDRIAAHKWRALVKGPNLVYAIRTAYMDGRQKTVLMHREIRPDIVGDIDHQDGDGLNNGRVNLRPCSDSQNGGNRRKGVGHTSKWKGVSWHTRKNNWKAQIQINGRRVYLGSFLSEMDAAEAYNRAAAVAFGEFAKLNEL